VIHDRMAVAMPAVDTESELGSVQRSTPNETPQGSQGQVGLTRRPRYAHRERQPGPRSTTQAAIALFPLEPMPAPDKLGCPVSDGQSPDMAIVTLAGSRSRGGAYSCAGWASPLLPKPYQPNSALHYRELHSVSCTPPMPSIASTSPRTRPGPASPGRRSVGFLACWERAAPRTSSEPLRVCRRLQLLRQATSSRLRSVSARCDWYWITNMITRRAGR
jgi:hypothetical protein